MSTAQAMLASAGDGSGDGEMTMMEMMMAAQADAAKAKEAAREKEVAKGDESFGEGLKGGFFSGGGANKKTKKPATKRKVSGKNSKPAKAKKNTASSDEGFGGLKKGFLSGGGAAKKKTKGKKKAAAASTTKAPPAPRIAASDPGHGVVIEELPDDEPEVVPFLRKKAPDEDAGDADAKLRLPEVQEAMKGAPSIVQDGNWMTPELMAKMGKDPRLLRGFMNPRFKGLLESLQKDPQGTLLRAKDDPEAREFLEAFMKLMGDHFTELGKKQDEEAAAAAAAATADPEVSRVLSDPELRALLEDPEMKRVLQEAQVPGKLQYFLSIPHIAAKLRKLAAAGLIRFDG